MMNRPLIPVLLLYPIHKGHREIMMSRLPQLLLKKKPN